MTDKTVSVNRPTDGTASSHHHHQVYRAGPTTERTYSCFQSAAIVIRYR